MSILLISSVVKCEDHHGSDTLLSNCRITELKKNCYPQFHTLLSHPVKYRNGFRTKNIHRLAKGPTRAPSIRRIDICHHRGLHVRVLFLGRAYGTKARLEHSLWPLLIHL
jgi:hypothetical protein